MPEFKCIDCNFETKKKTHWERHLQTQKHILSAKRIRYSCEKCYYHTANKSDFTKHLLTAKHIKNTSVDTVSEIKNLLIKQIAYLEGLNERIRKMELIVESLQNPDTVT